MKIGKKNTDEAVYVIAEIGNNHEGDFDLACRMIHEAAATGVDAVKFQTIIPEKLVPAGQTDRISQLQKFQFSRDQFEQLASEAEKAEVAFLSTPFDPDVVEWLDPLVDAWKIASCDNDFYPLLARVAETGKPVIVSMGLGHHSEAVKLSRFFRESWEEYEKPDPGLAFLHCVVSYPTPDNEAGLSQIAKLNFEGVTCGYSDHTIGIKAAELAVAAGARVIEKHFTINKNHSSFRDHQLSADPEDLRNMVAAIRRAEEMMGASTLDAQSCEESNRNTVRRSLTALLDIPAGDLLTMENLGWLRPGGGIRPGGEDEILGKPATSAIAAGEQVSRDHIS